ncbi:MAG: AraC family transcriptional regulator [Burkholderiales bacterium]|jgi:AraC-like DNA-binding protein|nr:AraC family transcriptional regulator [Burkholderiales bacterium]
MDHSRAGATATALLSPALNLYRALEARGLDAAALFRRAGCDPELLRVQETRVTNRTVRRLYEVAEEATGDVCIGIDVGAQFRGVAMHALGHAWLASGTLAEAMLRISRYTRVLSEFWHADLREEPAGVRFAIAYRDRDAYGPLSRHDAVLAATVKLARITYGEAFAPLEVTVQRERPGCAHRFEEWFRAPIVWAAPQPSLLFRREDLSRPLATANSDVAVASEQIAADYAARLDRDDIRTRVKRELLGVLPSGAPSQMRIARSVGLSSRTLHRRLAESETSFAALLDETRRDLALEYLRRSDYAVGEVAYMLGFAETSSFNRAFKRWTGLSPSDYRRAPAEATADTDRG